MARESLPKLQQAHLYNKDGQRNGNAGDSVPEAHGVPLEGEWVVWKQQRSKELKCGPRRVERTAGCANCDSRARRRFERIEETEETAEVKSNGRQSGIGVRPYYVDEGNWQAGKRDGDSSNARRQTAIDGL